MRKLALFLAALMVATVSFAAPATTTTKMRAWMPSVTSSPVGISNNALYYCDSPAVPSFPGNVLSVHTVGVNVPWSGMSTPFVWAFVKTDGTMHYFSPLLGETAFVGVDNIYFSVNTNMGLIMDSANTVLRVYFITSAPTSCTGIKINMFYELLPLQ